MEGTDDIALRRTWSNCRILMTGNRDGGCFSHASFRLFFQQHFLLLHIMKTVIVDPSPSCIWRFFEFIKALAQREDS